MKVVVLGGDGFCGWPTSLHLSARGHDVLIVDNLIRRSVDVELGTGSLTPIAALRDRLSAWKSVSGAEIRHIAFDVAEDYPALLGLMTSERPDAVIHMAEQRAAPFSMKSPRHKRLTVDNNVRGTHNLLCSIVESGVDAHVVHIGSMGVYGYGDGWQLPEGYMTVRVEADGEEPIDREILHPFDPGSVYHLTKCLDQQLFHFYAKNDRLRVTDLHQGIVWGTNTPETKSHPALINRFDYDGDYGTVLNRFLMQAAIGYPLTIHGSGEQMRAFIHLRDTVRCIELALLSPPALGDRVRILNQMSEAHRICDLADIVSQLTGTPVQHVANPRREAVRNDLRARASSLVALGLEPTLLARDLLEEVIDIARRFADRCDRSRIPCTSLWVSDAVVREQPV